MNSYHALRHKLAVIGMAAAALTAPSTATAEPFIFSGTARQHFVVEIPAGHRPEARTLFLQAWLNTSTFSGYRRSFRVFWDEAELTRSLNIPEVFTLRDERQMQSYSPADGWAVPFTAGPEQIASSEESGYYPIDGAFVPGVFEFELDDVSPGRHTLVIESTTDVDNELMVDGLKLESATFTATPRNP